jgi:hypothetical protein
MVVMAEVLSIYGFYMDLFSSRYFQSNWLTPVLHYPEPRIGPRDIVSIVYNELAALWEAENNLNRTIRDLENEYCHYVSQYSKIKLLPLIGKACRKEHCESGTHFVFQAIKVPVFFDRYFYSRHENCQCREKLMNLDVAVLRHEVLTRRAETHRRLDKVALIKVELDRMNLEIIKEGWEQDVPKQVREAYLNRVERLFRYVVMLFESVPLALLYSCILTIFPGRHRPPCKTMPWDISPALVVL